MDTAASVIFDFDSTLIDCDSDQWVVDQLGATELFNSLLTSRPWNDAMETLMAALHAQGKTIQDIETSLRSIPLQPEKISALKEAHALGCELRIVSDANAFFIKTILDKYEVANLFKEIHTNPAYVDRDNRLHISPFHPKAEPPHGCPLCPPNMCKGRIVDQIKRASEDVNRKRRIIYAGDGCGDYCPTLRLATGDSVLPREGFPLRALLGENANVVKAEIHGWTTAKDMEEVLIKLLTTTTSHDKRKLPETQSSSSSSSSSSSMSPLYRKKKLPNHLRTATLLASKRFTCRVSIQECISLAGSSSPLHVCSRYGSGRKGGMDICSSVGMATTPVPLPASLS